MREKPGIAVLLLIGVFIFTLPGCKGLKKNATAPVTPAPVVNKLKNGFTVITIEDHKEPWVAVETFYRAGFAHEPKGKPNLSHLAEHLWLMAATETFEPLNAFELIQRKGMINGETMGNFVHFDCVLPAEDWEMAMRLEAERMTSLKIEPGDVSREIPRMLQELENVQKNPGGLIKFGLMGLVQVVNHGAREVNIIRDTRALTADDAREFIKQYYAPANGIVVIAGDVDAAKALEVAEKFLGALPPGQRAPMPPRNLSPGADFPVPWDLYPDVVYFADPAPVESLKDRLALTLFGNSLLKSIVKPDDQSRFCSSQLYPTGDLPFFIFSQPPPISGSRHGLELISAPLVKALDSALKNLNKNSFDNEKSALINFMRFSLLSTPGVQTGTPYNQVLAQEAINTGVKELLREGLSEQEFEKLVQSIDFEYAQKVINGRLWPGRFAAVYFEPKQP